jgi:hypothetical protein
MYYESALAPTKTAKSSSFDGVGLQDFFSKYCFKGHPKPYADFMDWRKKEDEMIEFERQKLIPGM